MQTLLLFLVSVIVALEVLAPQPRVALGSELIGTAVLVAAAMAALDRRAGHDETNEVARVVGRNSPNFLTTVCVAVAGATLLAEAGGGLYWLLPATALSLLGGTVNAWLFLLKVDQPKILG